MRQINSIIIHCSDSDAASHDDISVIRKWHVEERGWSDVGYHFFITNNGTIENGRHPEKIGAHCKGMNSNSIGVCLHGKTKFTKNQFKALSSLIKSLCVEYGIKEDAVFGHYDFSNKTCPNFDVNTFKRLYL